jgi:glycine cleavage system regulatory protein
LFFGRFIGGDPFAGKSDRRTARSYRDGAGLVGARLAREGVGRFSAATSLAYTSLSTTKEGCAMDHLVLTVFAPDKPGQVERIAQCIAEHGGNWLESRMSRMAGQFAGILRVGVPAEAYDELVDALQALSVHGIRVLIAESGIEQSCTWKPIAMELVGNDRPGIVRDITRLLSEQGVNLERLVTEVRPAPMSSEPLFHAEAILAVPLTLSLDVLQSRLETLADDLMVELVLRSDP